MYQTVVSGSREWGIRILLLLASCVIALLLAETVARVFFSISDGQDNVSLDGKPIKEWFSPGSVYRQVSNEYNAITTITKQGHRVPGVEEGSPDIVFLGDSFTYGFGLSDDETFSSIYCAQQLLQCVNLGMPGSGTLRQVKRLERFIQDWGWKPREVKLFFFGMSGSFSSGNDFVDNYNSYTSADDDGREKGLPRQEPEIGLAERFIGLQSFVLDRSVLMRLVKYYWGPILKSLIVADPGKERMRVALAATAQYLRQLDELSQRVGFEYSIYLFVPVQDIMRGTYGETLETLNSVSPRQAVPTAQLFLDAPQKYYYAFDGHLNPIGSRRIAEFLIESEQAKRSSISSDRSK